MTWDNLHDEDVLYDFRGESAKDLTPGRFYRGTVDGFAEFGVFVTLSEGVTGLLHRSKLDRRLESLDWDSGDEIIVQVEGVRDNGNIDLDWSIRQSDREFRGHDTDPSGIEADETDEEPDREEPQPPVVESEETTEPSVEPVDDTEPEGTTAIARESVENLDESIGERVRLEGRITEIRQTSGPTIFSIADESGVVEIAAFESAGVRAYPDLETEDFVRVVGLVERHRGDIQLESESIEPLEEPDRSEVRERLETAAKERARPDNTDLLLVDPIVADLADEFVAVATRLRQAVLEGRSVLVRHPATADGVIAGTAVEHALRSLYDKERSGVDGSRAIDRRPMDDPWYELGDAMYDRGHQGSDDPPLVVLVGAGSSDADRPALDFLEIYDVPTVVIDAFAGGAVPPSTKAAAISQAATNASVLAAHVAGIVEGSVRDDVSSLPAISYRENPPDRYAELAVETGLDKRTVRERHEAIALMAYYQRYDDKRELVEDLLLDGEAAELAEHVSAQYRERIETAVKTAQNNCDRITMVDRTITVLDGDAHSHRFDFPPRTVLTEELLRAEREQGAADIVIVIGTDECYLAGAVEDDLPTIAAEVAERVPDGAVDSKRNRLTFLSGSRDAVREALVDVLADHVAA